MKTAAKIKPEKPKKQSKRGRPTSYNSDNNEKVFKLCLLGATDKDIADFFGVSESTLNNWKIEYPEFLESIKKGKQEADANVGSALYSRAIGHKKKDCEEVFQYQGKIVRAKTTKYFPPDVTAIIFWLKNRQPTLWRDKQVQEITGKDGEPIKFEGFNFLPQ
ncbi:MAG: helix-turn-helix domain-containing protein [Paludibacter sp.]|nr:helix-turn-helix domain-containing protein [Paludibacter sp.]